MNHLTANELIELALGEDSPDRISHLRSCRECAAKFEAIRATETALRTLRPDRAPKDFTNRVMRRLGIGSAPAFGWMLLKNVAPLLALTAVLGVAIALLNRFGALQGTQLGESAGGIQSAYSKSSQALASGVLAFNAWMERYFSFAFAKSAHGMTIFLVCLFGATALLDKYLIVPLMRKRR